MHFRSRVLLFVFAVGMCISAQAQWLTDYSSALKKAQAEDKAVLINFTGSDWCPACISLKKEVFDTAQFKAFANEHLVLLEVDFPRRKVLSAEQIDKNKRMTELFPIEYYPTVFVVDKDGHRLAQPDNLEGGPAPYIAQLKRIPGFPLRIRDTAGAAKTIARPPSVKPAPPAKKQKELPAYAVSAPVIRYDKIALKGIFGAKSKVALINNESLGAGEKGKIKVEDKIVEVLVKEIRENSVLVQIEGETEPRELTLK